MKPELLYRALAGTVAIEMTLKILLYTLLPSAVAKPENSSDNLGMTSKVSVKT